MLRSTCLNIAAFAVVASMPTASIAASKEDKKVMRLIAECAYVVKVAEGNGVKLRNSAAKWDQATAGAGLKLGIDPASYQAEARAKYKKRERVMGSGEALRKLIGRARDCDAQL